MAKAKIPKSPDQEAPTNQISELPSRSGVIDSDLYQQYCTLIANDGKQVEPTIYELKMPEHRLVLSTETGCPGISVINGKTCIIRCYFPPKMDNETMLSECLRHNTVMMLGGDVPFEHHEEMNREIEAQARLLPVELRLQVGVKVETELQRAEASSVANPEPKQ